VIPHRIHFVWIGPERPWWAIQNAKMFADFNPGFTIQWHGEEVLLKSFEYAYRRIDESPQHVYARRADILRVCALLRHGGWYIDSDFMPIRPLWDLYREYGHFPSGCFLTRCANHHQTGLPIIANGFIASTPDSPMLGLIATGIMMAAETERELAWDAYGPGLYTRLVGLYPELVRLGAMSDFYRIENHEESQAAYKRIAAAGFAFKAQEKELGTPMPHMFHIAMRGEAQLDHP
jgi:hypothetical protein